MMYKRILVGLILLVLSIGIVSASDDVSCDFNLTEDSQGQYVEIDGFMQNDDCKLPSKEDTKIESKNITTYYKEKTELIGYLKDVNSHPISNKTISIFVNNKIYNKTTDNLGKVVLNLNLKANTYLATIKFNGDENYTSSSSDFTINVKKASLAIETKDYKTYLHSDLFFKAKVINKNTKNPVEGIKVTFKVFTGQNKYLLYYATTNSKGVASLKKNFKVGSYKIVTKIDNKNIKSEKAKSTMTVIPTPEMGCCSFYLQVSSTEAVAGFRRDSTIPVKIFIKAEKWNGRNAIKQYKVAYSYFFHSITTADGWMIGTGGPDDPAVNKAIENLAGKMVKSGKIQMSYLKKIQKKKSVLTSGHFSIKAPDGKYAVVWGSKICTGKLKPGEYFSSPNSVSNFRHGKWAKFNSNPDRAAIKVGATDLHGINRRDITIFHWKATTNQGKTTSVVKSYGANDNGRFVGRSTAHLKDNICFKNKFISKNKLPNAPSMMYLGYHKFGSIDTLIKTQTTVSAPDLTKLQNESKTFDITVKDKKTNKSIKNLKLKLKIGNKLYSLKTNSKGIVKFNTDSLRVGSYNVTIFSDNIKFYVSCKSTIMIK